MEGLSWVRRVAACEYERRLYAAMVESSWAGESLPVSISAFARSVFSRGSALQNQRTSLAITIKYHRHLKCAAISILGSPSTSPSPCV